MLACIALVDEAGLRVVAIFAGPGAEQVVVQRRAAGLRSRPASSSPAPASPPGWSSAPRSTIARAHLVMAERRCIAHRLDLRRRVEAVAQRRTPAAARPGRCSEPQEAEALVRARTSSSVVSFCSAIAVRMRALADAVAAADLGRVGQAATPRWVACAAPATAWPNTSVSRMSAMSVAVAHQVEIPGAVGGVAVQHRADQLVVAQHQLLVDAARGVAEDDVLACRRRRRNRRPRTRRCR